MKRNLSVLLILMIVLCSISLLPAAAEQIADETELASTGSGELTENGFVYYVEDASEEGDLYAVVIDCTLTGKVTIPEKLGGYPVRRIEWNDNLRSFTEVMIPDCVEGVSGGFNSSQLTQLTFASDCEFYGWSGSLFSACPALTSINFPENSAYSFENSFIILNGERLVACLPGVSGNVIVPSGVEEINDNAFAGCVAITAVTLPETVERIYSDAFDGCEKLKEYTILSDNLSLIEKNAIGYHRILDGDKTKFPKYEKYDGIVINGYPVSEAENYARVNGFSFVALNADYPMLTSLENIDKGVKFNWNGIAGYDTYRVFYQNDYGRWHAFATVKGTSFVDTTIRSGELRTYTIRCVDDNGQLTGKYKTNGWTTTFYSVPEIGGVTNAKTGKGIEVIVKAPGTLESELEVYCRLYRKTPSTGWEGVRTAAWNSADISKYDYSIIDTEVQPGTTYTYAVRLINTRRTAFLSGASSPSAAYTYRDAPQLTSITNVNNGVKLTWNKFSGAYAYRVFFKSGNGWKTLGKTTGATFTDTKVRDGEKRIYTVRAENKKGAFISNYVSDYGNGWANVYYAPPVISKIAATKNGVTLTLTRGAWCGLDLSYECTVYRKTAKTSWTPVGGVDISRVFTDKEAISGTRYSYTCRLNRLRKNTGRYDIHMSGYNSIKSVTAAQLNHPVITQCKNRLGGVELKWTAVSGAKKYGVYTYDSWKDKPYTRIATVSGTSYLNKAADKSVNDPLRIYVVRAIDANNKLIGTVSPLKTNVWVDAPQIRTIANTSDGVSLTWNYPEGIGTSFTVYRKTADSSWTKIGEVRGELEQTSYTYVDKKAVSGTKYTYTLRSKRVIEEDGFGATGVSAYYDGREITCRR